VVWSILDILACAPQNDADIEAPDDSAIIDDTAPLPDACGHSDVEPAPTLDGCFFEYAGPNTYSSEAAVMEATEAGLVLRYAWEFWTPGYSDEWGWVRGLDDEARPEVMETWRSKDGDPPEFSGREGLSWTGETPMESRFYEESGNDGAGACPVMFTTTLECEGERLTGFRRIDDEGDELEYGSYSYEDGRIIAAHERDAWGGEALWSYAWTDDRVDWCVDDRSYTNDDRAQAAADGCPESCSRCGYQTFDDEGRLVDDVWDGRGTNPAYTYDAQGRPTGDGYYTIDTDCDYGELRRGILFSASEDVDPAALSLREAVPCY
jgi:YD repeat-containing protein